MYNIRKTYEDFNGVERTEDFLFHLNKAELLEMEVGTDGGYGAYVQRIIDAKDAKTLMGLFKDLVLKAYGVKSDDGKRFIKNDEVRLEFEQCPAYSDIFMELALDDKKAADFVNGIVPKDMIPNETPATIAAKK